MEQDAALELHQFPHSHYNEKVRWALDFKNVPHKRISYLPGLHTGPINKLSGGTKTPVLKIGGMVIAGSAAIIDALEANYPAPALYPSDPAQKKAALEIQSYFDTEVGPLVRRALFSELVHEPGLVCRIFAGGKPLHTRLFYRALQPVARRVMAAQMELNDPDAVAAAFRMTKAALDRVAAQAGPSGYLAGDSFSIADLAAAALLAPACNPPHPDMEFPAPVPQRVEDWFGRWSDHPGARWVRGIYRQHRPTRILPLRAAAD